MERRALIFHIISFFPSRIGIAKVVLRVAYIVLFTVILGTVSLTVAKAELILYEGFEGLPVGKYGHGIKMPNSVAKTHGEDISSVSSPTRSGDRALKFHTYYPSYFADENMRSELLIAGQRTKFPAISEGWFGFSLFVPEDVEEGVLGGVQWHSEPDPDSRCGHVNNGEGEWWRYPPTAMSTDGKTWKLWTIWDPRPCTIARSLNKGGAGINRYTLGAVKRGAWTDFVFHIKFNFNPEKGLIQVWKNGKLVLDENTGTTYNDLASLYFMGGIYNRAFAEKGSNYGVRRSEEECKTNYGKWGCPGPDGILYMDEIRIGDANSSYDEVKPRGNSLPSPEEMEPREGSPPSPEEMEPREGSPPSPDEDSTPEHKPSTPTGLTISVE